jgi:hypothetical protein
MGANEALADFDLQECSGARIPCYRSLDLLEIRQFSWHVDFELSRPATPVLL